jgi:hypothetical protein
MESVQLIWGALAAKERVTRAASIRELARRAQLDPDHTIRALRRENRIEPLFKGYYLVKRPEEVLLHEEPSPLELFALGAQAKGIGTWYFALETALRLNGLSHEYSRIEHVVSDALQRATGVPIGGRRFIIHKWRPARVGFGLRRRGTYRFSDPEKTVLDLAYVDATAMKRGRSPSLAWKECLDKVDPDRIASYLEHYPGSVRELVEDDA